MYVYLCVRGACLSTGFHRFDSPPQSPKPHHQTSPQNQKQAAAWYYVDKDGQQAGPADVKALAGLFAEGELDGMTVVWHSELPGGWKPLSEVSVYVFVCVC